MTPQQTKGTSRVMTVILEMTDEGTYELVIRYRRPGSTEVATLSSTLPYVVDAEERVEFQDDFLEEIARVLVMLT